MKRTSSKNNMRKTGFTLVELLVAITILSIILLALGAAMGFVTRLWLNGIGTVDNFTKARVILNLLDRDIQMMVMRPDLAAFVDSKGNAACAFYTNVQGSPGSDTRTVSLVEYLMVNPATGLPDATGNSVTLGRLNYGMNFTASGNGGITPQIISYNLTAPTPTPPALTQLEQVTESENIASGVLLFQWQFIDGTGAILNPPYTPNTSTSLPANVPFYYDYTIPGASYNPHVVVVSILVISNSAYTIAEQTGKLSLITENFTGTLPANETYSQYWNGILSNPPPGLSSLPAQIRDGIRVFERHIPLPIATAASS